MNKLTKKPLSPSGTEHISLSPQNKNFIRDEKKGVGKDRGIGISSNYIMSRDNGVNNNFSEDLCNYSLKINSTIDSTKDS